MKKLIIPLVFVFAIVASISMAQNSSSKSTVDEKTKKQQSTQSQPAEKKDSPLVQAAKKEQERRGKIESAKTKTFTNQDIQDFKEKNKDQGWDTDSDADSAEQTEPIEAQEQEQTSSQEKDLANDEQYWRNRHSEAVARLNAAQQNVERIQSEFNALQRAFYAEGDGVAQRGKIGAEANERLSMLDEAKKELQAATEAMSGLEEEARRAGALPGWIRD